jgi:hypothetical protein
MSLPRCLSLTAAVDRVGAVAYGDHWVKSIESGYAAVPRIRASAWLKSHDFNTAAGARIDRERFEKVLAQDPPNKDGDWVVVERRAPDFAVGEEHTVFEWCMIYTANQPTSVPIYNGTTVENMNGRLRMIGVLPPTDFTRLLVGPRPWLLSKGFGAPPGSHVRKEVNRMIIADIRAGFGAPPASVKKHPDSQVRNEVFRTIEADIRADRIIPLKLAYCSDQPERFDPTRCVIGITPVLALARLRKDFGQTMAELLVAHSGASNNASEPVIEARDTFGSAPSNQPPMRDADEPMPNSPPKGTRTNKEAAAEKECKDFIRGLKERPKNKDSAFEDAKAATAEIGLLSRKAFDRAWADNVPDKWKYQGRRKLS